MIKDLGYEYKCDACDYTRNDLSLPQGWTKGEFVIKSGYSFGEILICKTCYSDEVGSPIEKGNITFKKLWHKFGWGKKSVEVGE